MVFKKLKLKCNNLSYLLRLIQEQNKAGLKPALPYTIGLLNETRNYASPLRGGH